MNTLPILLKFSRKQSGFRIITTLISVILATTILMTVASLGQGLMLRQQKTDFISALLTEKNKASENQNVTQDPIHLSSRDINFHNVPIQEMGIRANGQTTDLPAGLNKMPPKNEIWVTPALQQLIDKNQSLKDRYQGFTIKSDFPESLAPSPDSLMLLFYIPDSTLNNPEATLRATNADDINKIYNAQKNKNDLQTKSFKTALMLVGVILATPVFILITEVARINMTQRERRYASLSLVGATTRQIQTMIALEVLPLSLISIVLGLLLFTWLGMPALSHVSLGDQTSWISDMQISGSFCAIITLLIILCVILANIQAVFRVRISPLAVSRKNSVKKHPSILTTAPLLLSVGMLYVLANYGKEWSLKNMEASGYARVALLFMIIVGLFVCGSYITYLLSFVVSCISRKASGVIAARRLRSIPRNLFHSISGIIIALFVGSLIVTTLSTFQSSYEHHNKMAPTANTSIDSQIKLPFQIDISMSGVIKDDSEVVSKFENNDAIKRATNQAYIQKDFRGYEETDEPIIGGSYYDSCDQLQQRTRIRCPNNFSGPVVVSSLVTTDSSGNLNMQWQVTPVDDKDGDITARSYVIVAKDQSAYVRLTEEVENIASNFHRTTGDDISISYERTSAADTAQSIKNINNLITAILVIVIITGGLSIFVSVVGSIYDRKQTFVQLRLLGASLPTLARSLMIEIISPLLVLSVIAIGLGMFCCHILFLISDAYTTGQMIFTIPDISFWISLGIAVIFCASLSLTVIPILSKLTKEEIRVE